MAILREILNDPGASRCHWSGTCSGTHWILNQFQTGLDGSSRSSRRLAQLLRSIGTKLQKREPGWRTDLEGMWTLRSGIEWFGKARSVQRGRHVSLGNQVCTARGLLSRSRVIVFGLKLLSRLEPFLPGHVADMKLMQRTASWSLRTLLQRRGIQWCSKSQEMKVLAWGSRSLAKLGR